MMNTTISIPPTVAGTRYTASGKSIAPILTYIESSTIGIEYRTKTVKKARAIRQFIILTALLTFAGKRTNNTSTLKCRPSQQMTAEPIKVIQTTRSLTSSSLQTKGLFNANRKKIWPIVKITMVAKIEPTIIRNGIAQSRCLSPS